MKLRLRIKSKSFFLLTGLFLAMGIFVYVFEASWPWISNIKIAYVEEIYIPLYRYILLDEDVSRAGQALLASVGLIKASGNESPNISANSIPVLLYHGIVDKPDGVNVLLSDFRDQMFALKKAGWNAIGLDDFYSFIRGEKTVPAKSFLLTFDDGRKDSYYPVDPILRGLDYKAVLFAIEKFSILDKNNYYLAKNELQEMVASGRWSIEAHAAQSHSNTFVVDNRGTLGPFFSNRLWLPTEGRFETPDEFTARVTNELRTARGGLESLLGTSVTSFAFPFNNFGEDDSNFSEAASIVVEATRSVYSLAFFQYSTAKIFSQNYEGQFADSNGFLIKRIEVHADWTPQVLLNAFQKGDAKAVPFVDEFSSDMGWVSTRWGTVDIVPGQGMTLKAIKDGTGSAVVLDGSRAWKDYELQSFVKWPMGSNIYIWSRVKDTNNYTACNFGKNLVHVEQTINSKTEVINGVEHNNIFPEAGFSVGMRVVGRHVACLLNGEVFAQTDFLDPALNYGGVGFKTWDATPGNAEMLVSHVSVQKSQ